MSQAATSLSLDWDDLRLVLLLAETGGARAAGQRLGITHSTLSRRILGLETRLGVQLFERDTRGFRLTEAGAELVAPIRRASSEIDAGLRQVAGADRRMEGPIRVTLPDFLAYYGLLPALGAFQQAHPGVDLEVDISYSAADLVRREADVAVRLLRPGESPPESLIGRKLAVSAATAYATPWYLAQHDLSRADGGAAWLGWEAGSDEAWRAETPYLHLPATGHFNHAELQHHAARAHLGIAYIPCLIGDSDPELVRAPDMTPRPARDVWLLTHVDLRNSARMKKLRRVLEQAVLDIAPRLIGERPRGTGPTTPPPGARQAGDGQGAGASTGRNARR